MLPKRRSRSRRPGLRSAGPAGQRVDRRHRRRVGVGGRWLLPALCCAALLGIGFALGRFTARRAPVVTAASAVPATGGGSPDRMTMVERGTDRGSAGSRDTGPTGSEAGHAGAAAASGPSDVGTERIARSGKAPTVAIVIDDLGRSVEVVDELHGLGVPLTYAVLPFESRTAAVAARLRERGEEFLCHLPMEAEHGVNPGPGALDVAMDGAELRAATRRAVDAVPGAIGVNNHMGSMLSADPVAMGAVLDVVREDGLFFLDSRTSAASVAYRLARDLGIPAAERKVFLDDDRDPAAIRHEIYRLLALASTGDAPAIAIGHPYPETLAVLAEEIPRARAEGYRFVRVSALLAEAPTQAPPAERR